jgi:molybdopterin-guanine dinucleotide biosynthesis adapter protein
MTSTPLPMLGIAAWSGTGKTTLLRALLPLLRTKGLRVGVVKHTHHDFDIDLPGKDSYELRRAGATQVLIGSRRRWALIVETDLDRDPPLAEMLAHIGTDALDLILIEGLKNEPIPKLEVHRPAMGRPLLCVKDPHVIAIATDAPVTPPRAMPVIDLNDIAAIASFVVDFTDGSRDGEPVTIGAVGTTA